MIFRCYPACSAEFATQVSSGSPLRLSEGFNQPDHRRGTTETHSISQGRLGGDVEPSGDA